MDWRNHTIEKIREEERLIVCAGRRGISLRPGDSVADNLDHIHGTLLAALEQTHNECVAEAIVLLEALRGKLSPARRVQR